MIPMITSEAQTTLERAVRPAALYRVAEAAMMVGLHDETLRRWIRAGKVRAWGSPLKVSLDDVMPRYQPTHRKK